MTTETKNKPHMGKIGRVRYKVWTNRNDQGRSQYTVEIFRSYSVEGQTEGTRDWREVHSFSPDDLKLIPLVMDEVERYIAAQNAALAA